MTINPMSVPTLNDADLVQASLAGRRDAFGQIVARYQALVCALAYSATGSLSRSEDLAQDTFVAAWRQLPELREPAKLRAWLCGIARHLISNSQRRAGREPAHLAEPFDPTQEAAALEPSPPEQAVSREEEAILWRALEKIPETYREPLVLFYREHRSVESVARELELSEDAVKQRLSRGRALLHEQVLVLVEGTLERSNPGRAFTGTVLAALPVIGTGAGAAAAGASAARASGATKAASSAGGVGGFAGVLGLLSVLGGYVGWQMGDTAAQSPAERLWVVRFWRVVAGGFVLFFLPALGLALLRRSYPLLQVVATLWLGLFFVAVTVGFAMYAWRQHRRIRRHERAAETEPSISRKRLIIWVAIGTLAMALLLPISVGGGWQTHRLGSAEAPAFIAAHPTAQFYFVEYQDGQRSLSIRVTEDERHSQFVAPLDERTLAALKERGVPVKTLAQGRDFEILGWPGRMLFVLALLIVAAGVATLARTLRRGQSVPKSAAPTNLTTG